MDIKKLEEEFIFIADQLLNFEKEISWVNEVYKFPFNRAMCKKELVGDNYECLVNKAEMVVNIFNMDINKLDGNIYNNIYLIQ